MFDAAVVGAGIAGMATAARLQAAGLATIVLEAHGQPGGCAGFFRRRGFAFDVGATTLVDFEPGGVGGELLAAVGLSDLERDALPGYRAWLPDRTVALSRDPTMWAAERRRLGDTPAHRAFWSHLDRIAGVFWRVTRAGAKLPLRSLGDIARAARLFSPAEWPLLRYLRWTVGDLLRHHGLRDDRPLCGLLSMLLQDTVHAAPDDAPLINGALGVTMRGAGLTRARGGMGGFWKRFVARYRALGGVLRVGCPATRIEPHAGGFLVVTRRGIVPAAQVVCALPAPLALRLAPPAVVRAVELYVRRDAARLGGAVIVFLGVPDEEVEGQRYTHHQLLENYDRPLGDGNNLFISVSARGDAESAPPGFRAVMISTHCELAPWEGLSDEEYQRRKEVAGERLVSLARRVYPNLGRRAAVYEVGTPRTYARFTGRPRGAVGGVRQSLRNANQRALPHDVGVPGFWLAGDSTWPGLGTVACVLGSRIVAEGVLAARRRPAAPPRAPTEDRRVALAAD